MTGIRDSLRKIIDSLTGKTGQQKRQHTHLILELLEERTLLAVNPIVLENQKPGNPMSEWGINGAGDPSIQGFASDISVNKGQSIGFKINTDSTNYIIDIYRLGYYGGLGARKVDSITMRLRRPQVQPNPIVDNSTGLVDAGNWRTTVTWQVPNDAVSGIYFAKLTRLDGSRGSSHLYFVVRDDDSHSDILMQTSDTTWQAYNSWGGKSLYDYLSSGGRRAYKVSYNRPFDTRSRPVGDGQANFVFWAEYPMVRWLEANGYNVSYFTNVDTARYGNEIKEHKVFISVGHDEYWSAEMWQNVQAARDAGVHIVFLAGNNIYWKTRWEASIDGSGTPYRTLVCYKESLADAKIDPMPNVWTGLWRDPRFSPPADGGRPENALGGTIFTVNRGPDQVGTPIEVPYEFRQLRLWRNTDIQNLQPGQVAYLGQYTLGYEWNEDLDNGFRPPGQIRLSSTTQQVPQKLLDYGKSVGPGTATHNLTMYRAASGALVFSAGTVQWVWGLDDQHDGSYSPADKRIQQATVNLLADMGVQPSTLQPGLVTAFASTDQRPPVTTISISNGSSFPTNIAITISGSATDSGGGVVAGVEVSWDGGQSWHPAEGTTSWVYIWNPPGPGTYQLMARAIDDSVNIGSPTTPITVLVASQDTRPPVISSVAAQADTNSATIAWQTDELADSIVLYGLDPQNLQHSLAMTELVTNHTVILNGLNANTTYYYRVSSADRSGNRSWYPAPGALSFRTAAFVDDTVSDFQQGQPDQGIEIAQMENGEITLKPALSADFAGSSLPATFSISSWAANGSAVISNGVLHLDGAMIQTGSVYSNGTVMEFRARFLPTGYQHMGFATDLNAGPWLIFSTKDGRGLFARSFMGNAIETSLGSQWLGSYHTFRIELQPNNVSYYIDGTLVAQHAIAVATNLRIAASDYAVDNSSLDIDWLRVGPYASNGSYISRIFDAGQRVLWDRISWDASVPSDSSLGVLIRMGNTPVPDNGWTDFIPVPSSGYNTQGTARYLQYKLVLSANNAFHSGQVPILRRIAFNTSPASADSMPPFVISRDPAAGATISNQRPEIRIVFNELLDASSVNSSTVQVVENASGSIVPANLSVQGNMIRVQPLQDLLVNSTYTVTVRAISDLQGNIMPDAVSWSFKTPQTQDTPQQIIHTTVSDFATGQLDNTVITDDGDGAVSLRPSVSDTFDTPSLSSLWSTTVWQPNGSVNVQNGAARLDGIGMFSASTWPSGQFVEFRAAFTGAPYQHIGFAQDMVNPSWAIFSTGDGGALLARTSNGAQTVNTVIPGSWLGQYHVFRIEWLSNQVLYYIDGKLEATHSIAISDNLRLAASDYVQDGSPVTIDWIRAGRYAGFGTYMSGVLDAGVNAVWIGIQWSGIMPANSSMQIAMRAGPNPTPDSSWSAFVPVTASGVNPGLVGRYVQYKVSLATSDRLYAPQLSDIRLVYTPTSKRIWPNNSYSDFISGQASNILITKRGNGELQLAGKLSDDFDGPNLSNQWTYQTWSGIGGGPATLRLSNGRIAVGGSAILSAVPVNLVSIQGTLSFSLTGYQNFGLATGLDDPGRNVWLLFGTSPNGTRLLARANVFGVMQDRDLGPISSGEHLYRLVPSPGRVDFYIDGNLVASLGVNLPGNVAYKLVLSDFYGTTPVVADWMEASGYPASGTYISTVFDAGQLASWGRVIWSGGTPVGTSIMIETRSGNTPAPDGSWSAWSPVGQDGIIGSPPARYLQYRLTLLTTDADVTPILDGLNIEWAPA